MDGYQILPFEITVEIYQFVLYQLSEDMIRYDNLEQVVATYRVVFNRLAPLPDVERLHPAELVGSYSR